MNKKLHILFAITALSISALHSQDRVASSPAPESEATSAAIMSEKSYPFNTIPFKKPLEFQANTVKVSSQIPKVLQPLGDPSKLPTNRKQNDIALNASSSGGRLDPMLSLTSALTYATPPQTPEKSKESVTSEPVAPTSIIPQHESVTISPLIQWLKLQQEAHNLATQRAAAYQVEQVKSTQDALRELSVKIQFPGNEGSGHSGSAVIYSTPVQ